MEEYRVKKTLSQITFLSALTALFFLSLVSEGSAPLHEAIKGGSSELVELLLNVGADPDYMDPGSGPPVFSKINPKAGEAAVWYLYHSGWAVKTQNTLLIFDYCEQMEKPDQPSLFNGFIHPEEIKDQNIYVFVSHSHGDHFDDRILDWKRSIPKITYIFGWKNRDIQGAYHFGKDRTIQTIGDLTVKNIFHDFDGPPESAFLIDVDGLTIYFSGDHGNSAGALHPVYKDNIDYISGFKDEIDLVFLSVFGGPSFEGELYAIKMLMPKVMLPMHYGGREPSAERFVLFGRPKFPEVEFWFPLNRGDRFFYSTGRVKELINCP